MQDTTQRTPVVDLLTHTARADPGQRWVVWLVDALLVITPALAAAALLIAGLPALTALLATVAAAALVATLVALARTGRSLGHLAAGARTVAAGSLAPSGARLGSDIAAGRLRTFTLRDARDPVTPAFAPFRFPEPEAHAWLDVPVQTYALGATIDLDSGQRLTLDSALVIGRSPSAPRDAPAAVYQWPDLSRTLSKSHARFEWDGRIAWVTDLGSTNGTLLRTGETHQPLLPLQRTPLPPTAELLLGDRSLTVAVPQ